MNYQHLQQIVDNYIERFTELNTPPAAEYYKWRIIQVFRPMMDEALAAPDDLFPGKLYEVKKLTANLIDSYTQPLNGLVEFSKKEPATVRSMLQSLLAASESEIQEKQTAIQAFLDQSHRLKEKYFPDSYLYNDDLHSVTGYLFLYDPDHNYLYKATHCRDFADCIEFYDDWGQGASTRLDIFYRMCDAALEALRQNEPLMATAASRYEIAPSQMHPDSQKHILLFDLIYCCSTYGLFTGIHYIVPKGGERRLAQERKEKARELAERLEKAKQDFASLEEAKSFVTQVFQPGTVVCHKTYGSAPISAVNGTTFTANFPKGGEKSLGTILCIANRLITLEDTDSQHKLDEYRNLLSRDKQISEAVTRAEKDFMPYAEYLE